MQGMKEERKRFSGWQVAAIALVLMFLTAITTVLVLRSYLVAKPFSPVVLQEKEEKILQRKLSMLANMETGKTSSENTDEGLETQEHDAEGRLKPLAYTEENANREIMFTERELNALLAKNTDLANKMAIDLDDDLVSLRLLIPLDQDFPVLGGKTVRARAGAELAYRDNKPVVILKGVSLMGVPIPNAWLGGLKNIDLVQEFGNENGFWKTFSEGVETIRIRKGEMYIKLRE